MPCGPSPITLLLLCSIQSMNHALGALVIEQKLSTGTVSSAVKVSRGTLKLSFLKTLSLSMSCSSSEITDNCSESAANPVSHAETGCGMSWRGYTGRSANTTPSTA